MSGNWPSIAGPAADGVAAMPISLRSFSAQRKKARSFAPKLWSTFPTQFQNRSLLKCSAHGQVPLPRRNAGVDAVRAPGSTA